MKKKSLETMLYSTVGVCAMALILIAVNVITSVFKGRVDLTAEKVYTLSPGTKAILGKIDTPIRIRFYCTQAESATPETVFLKNYAKRVEDLLAEFKQVAGGKLIIEKYDPQPDSDAEDNARLNGVEGETLSNGERFYLGLSVSLLDERQTIPFLAPNRERLLEYDLARAISRVMAPEKPVVGVMSPLPVFGGPPNPMMMRMGQPQQQQPWAIVNELKNDFEVRRVEMTAEKIDDDIKVLVVIHPRDITDKAQFAIDQFILRGGKLIAFLDPLPLMDSREQNQMFGSIPNSGSNLDKLLKAWGLSFETGKVVADMNFKMQVGGRNNQPQDAPAFLSITKDGISSEDIVTSQLDNVWLPFAGAFSGTPVAGLKMDVLLKSTKESQLVDGFMAHLSGENIVKEFKPSGMTQNLAVRLTGKFKTAFPDGKPEEKQDEKSEEKKDEAKEEWLKEGKGENSVILVGDADMIYDSFAIRQIQSPFGTLSMLMNGNLNFAQNAVEQFTGDNNLITVRSRAVQNRPFTLVKQMQAEAEARYRSRIKELEESLADTQRQLNELQQKKEKGQRFILSPEQQAALENFRKKEAEVKIQLKEERKKLRRDIDSLERRLKWFNIAAMPLVVSASGLALAFFKRKRTSAK
ncbi:MAG TPA: Gldg family protein [Verrucomicrobiota bacterium]|nr:Gldg family protein [Verrucomicrobiota bacterium]